MASRPVPARPRGAWHRPSTATGNCCCSQCRSYCFSYCFIGTSPGATPIANGWHSRFKTWLRRFNGVASRYLANYSGWQRVLDAATPTLPADWLQMGIAGSNKSKAGG